MLFRRKNIGKLPSYVKEERNLTMRSVSLDFGSEGNIPKNVLIICSGGYESGEGDFLVRVIFNDHRKSISDEGFIR